MSASASFAPPPAVKGLSEVARVVDTFVAPGKTFRDILRSASFWLPLLLLVLSTLTSAVILDRQVGFDRMYQNSLEQSPRAQEQMANATPEQRAQQMKIGVAFTRGFTYGLPVVLLLMWVVYALMMWGLFNFALGAETKFPQVFAVTLYSSLPYLLMTLLLFLTLTFGGNAEAYDTRNPVGTNPAYYMTGLAPWLKALLTQFDLIRLWSLVLNTLGMAIIARKSIGQAALITVGLWLLGVILAVGSAAAFS